MAESLLWDALEQQKSGDWQQYLNDGSEALEWRLRAIDSATESIDIQTFLWSFDTVGLYLTDRLIRAAERGILIKILIDDSFLVGKDSAFRAMAAHENIEYRVFNPFKRRSDSFLTRQFLNLGEFGRLNHRMHNKMMIVDGKVAIVGGRNLADEYFGFDDIANFRDMELIVGGPILDEVANTFDQYWNDRWSRPVEELLSIPAAVEHALNEQLSERREEYLLETELEREQAWLSLVQNSFEGDVEFYADKPPQKNPNSPESAPTQIGEFIVTMIDQAETEVMIVSAYLIPSQTLEDAIERAAKRGVGVRILTNSLRSNNHVSAHSAYRNHIQALMHRGADLHEIRADASDRQLYMLDPIERKSLALHAKFFIVDSDKVFIGSANLDPRSLKLNTEVGLLVTSEELNRSLRLSVEQDFDVSNAWQLEFDDNGRVLWVSDNEVRSTQPANSPFQRLEDWLFSHLPVEGQL